MYYSFRCPRKIQIWIFCRARRFARADENEIVLKRRGGNKMKLQFDEAGRFLEVSIVETAEEGGITSAMGIT